MKEQGKNMVKSLAAFAGSIIMFLCGVFWKEEGFEGKGIFLIMCSLYTAMWVPTGIVGDRINAIFEDKKGQTSKSGSVENVVQ